MHAFVVILNDKFKPGFLHYFFDTAAQPAYKQNGLTGDAAVYDYKKADVAVMKMLEEFKPEISPGYALFI